jgi:hypothetical protein
VSNGSDYFLIDLPKTEYTTQFRVEPVLPSSTREQRECVERFARYFLRERHTGGLQFEAAEASSTLGFVPYQAYLFSIQDRYIGAGCFRHRGQESPDTPWVFDWIWIHPYFRSQGYLTAAWPVFVSTFGRFRLAYPLSRSMSGFLAKIGWQAGADTSRGPGNDGQP